MLSKAAPNQSILDLAVQLYGSAGSLAQVIADNITGDFELASGLTPGVAFSYDIENGSANKRVLRKLDGRYVMTFKTQISNVNIITEDGFNLLSEDGQNIVKE